ncbi:MAG: hypothetical protein AAGB06_04230, partial [Verrucomicrobiota bacterium]
MNFPIRPFFLFSTKIIIAILYSGCARPPEDEFTKSGFTPEQSLAYANEIVDYTSLIHNEFLPGPDYEHP